MVQAGNRPHTFHIPVMGTGFMIDAPLRVARYGISSVISLVDDALVEQMRRFHSEQAGQPYTEIAAHEDDARARRITAYLNLLQELVNRQEAALQASPFEPGSEITRYYELLPDGPLAESYRAMLAEGDAAERARRQTRLRALAVAAGIDVNIMSKGDRDLYCDGVKMAPRFSDASAALRGFALSSLTNASLVLSAGFNPRLYSYAAEFADLLPDSSGALKKRIILKVSDYHSAAVQGKFLAKRGVWISEYRVESGLNCGGHAFATQGLLLGPILDEFQQKKGALIEQLHALYAKALAARGVPTMNAPLGVRITVQGGIGAADEDRLLRERYGADGTGWATPFLLVPEVTNVDDEHLRKLCAAGEDDVYLSRSSPFGMPFWNLRTSASEDARRRRIAAGRPGSACTSGYVKLFNTEFTPTPICTASRQYQKLKLAQLDAADLTEEQRTAQRDDVMAKSCICHDLAGSATLKHGIDPKATPAVCCGPNIANFSRVASLEEMVGHIYGRLSLISRPERPHMLLRELEIYVDYLRELIRQRKAGLSTALPAFLSEFKSNLLAGIEHYRRLAEQFVAPLRTTFLEGLSVQRQSLEALTELS